MSSESDHWTIMNEEQGSRLWKFEAAPSEASRKPALPYSRVKVNASRIVNGAQIRGPMPILHISGYDRTIPRS